jgi:hypothetical protein
MGQPAHGPAIRHSPPHLMILKRDRARSARLGRWFRGLVALEQGLDGEHEGRHQRGAFLRPDHPTAAMTGEVCERHHAPPSYD